MNRKRLAVVLVVSLIVLLGSVSMTYGGGNEKIPHAPIIISKAEDLTSKNGIVGGEGTKEKPFLIAGWKIDASNTGYGIKISNVQAYFVISDISVQSASTVGIQLVGISHAIIQNCEFNVDGIGLSMKSVSSTTVKENRFTDCTGMGISMEKCKNNSILRNEFTGRNSGIVVMAGSTSNLFVANTFRGHPFFSLYLGSGGNRIYHNNFFQAVVVDTGYNVWDNGKEGNFWGKLYYGKDKNNDGIGDTPHKIQGGYNYDHHPLMTPWKS